ncbi:MAG: DUF1517 domain-containing protein [Pseudanabaenaceae cyanobacterium]
MKTLLNKIGNWCRLAWKPLLALVLAISLFFGNTPYAYAKRGGGRVGGGSFSRPSRPSAGSRSYSPSYPYRSVPTTGGGGFFFFPVFSGGGFNLFVGLLGLIVLMAIAKAILNAFKGELDEGVTGDNTKVTIAKIQVGLLATARQLQRDLTYMAMEADTSTSAGLTTVLRETTLALLRHPEYWVYVSSAIEHTNFAQAESTYNRLVMSERTKLSEEVLTNQKGKKFLKSAHPADNSPLTNWEAPSEYIVVTILTAIAGNQLAGISRITSSEDLRNALMALGSVNSDQLIAIEVMWEPQSEEYTLTADEVLTVYPDLVRI